MKKIKIIIVDDHLLFSNALNGLITDFKEFKVLKLLKNGKELVDYCNSGDTLPDIVLMDINMPIMDGIEATLWLRDHQPMIKVLALSMDNEEETILKMLRAGAKGYLLKDIHPSILEQALHEVATKGIFYTENVANTILHTYENPVEKSKIQLKEREIEFLKHVCTEMTYKQVADKMFLSPKTIDGYREALFVKLNAKSRIGLVLYAIKEEIVQV